MNLPLSIENGCGEKIIFQEYIQTPEGVELHLDGYCDPGTGPQMHVHYFQDESLQVQSGKMGTEILGQQAVYFTEGQTVIFHKGIPHRFWNAGEDILHIKGIVKPANSVVFYLSTLYAAQKNSGSIQPEAFDSAYLLCRYKHEYNVFGIPAFVRNLIIPMTYAIGIVLGKYKKFKNAPPPLSAHS